MKTSPASACPSSIEVLEARIAPAVIFLSGSASIKPLEVYKDHGGGPNATVNSIPDATTAGSTVAFVMGPGDSLVLDLDGDKTIDPGEPVLMKVSAGKVFVFATDFGDGVGGPADGKFNVNEITGLAVGNGFGGSIFTDITGSITTTFDAQGNFTPSVLQKSAILGLKIYGRVTGDILAGGTITNLNVGSGIYSSGNSVQLLATGDQADGQVLSYNGGKTNKVSSALFAANTAAGPSITNVLLHNGATQVAAGNGAEGGLVSGLAGGSIVNLVSLGGTGAFTVSAGHGGTSVGGAGGAGGSISKSSIIMTGSIGGSDNAALTAGAGGFGLTGGIGGSILTTTAKVFGSAQNFEVTAGEGGKSNGPLIKGAIGGSISGSTFTAAGSIGFQAAGVFSVVAGQGGDAAGTAVGGAGGSILTTSIQGLDRIGHVTTLLVAAGIGGDSAAGKGGAGGALTASVFMTSQLGFVYNAQTHGSVNIHSGAAGTGKTGGGVGGILTKSNIQLSGPVITESALVIHSGNGGNASGTGAAGAGGVLSLSTISIASSIAGTSVSAGNGGSNMISGLGGAGGGLLTSKVTVGTISSGSLEVHAGNGGSGTGNSGVGGALTALTLEMTGDITGGELNVGAGVGGDHFLMSPAAGAGGAGGSVTKSSIKTLSVEGDVILSAGNGGAGGGAKGGAGGLLNTTTLTTAGDTRAILILGSRGGSVDNGNGAGGAAGALSAITLNIFGDTVSGSQVISGGGGNGSNIGNGGNAGALSGVNVNVYAQINGLLVASDVAGNAGTQGAGGLGGAVSKVTVNDFFGGSEAIRVVAGTGGDGGGTGKGGNAGALNTVVLNGINSTFIVGASFGGKAGSVAGAFGGTGGSVSKISGTVGRLSVVAGDGGAGQAGTGGAGGSVLGVSLTAVGEFVRVIAAGNGGSGTLGTGAGGSVSTVVVPGDIGDFSSPFGVADINAGVDPLNGMGGIIAGQGGVGFSKNGSISLVTADRIAAMIAGRPVGAVQVSNEVTAISGIVTAVIGADVDNDGGFNFTNNTGMPTVFEFGDTPIDGLVLVKSGGFTAPPVTPLLVLP